MTKDYGNADIIVNDITGERDNTGTINVRADLEMGEEI